LAFLETDRKNATTTLQTFTFGGTVESFEVRNQGSDHNVSVFIRNSLSTFNAKPILLAPRQHCNIPLESNDFQYLSNDKSILEIIGVVK